MSSQFNGGLVPSNKLESIETTTGVYSVPFPAAANHAGFTATHWSVILAAANGESSPALEELCRTYWYPLYVYVRRRGYGPEQAQDLTQEFFARLLAKRGLETVNPLKGKFRSFLLKCMNHLLADVHDYETRQKRGGGQPVLSFDAAAAEQRYGLEPVEQMTPEKIFERRWVVALLEQVLNRLRDEYSRDGKLEVFGTIQHFLTAEQSEHDYPAAARQLGMTEGAVRVAVHRLRRRYGALFRESIAQTLDPSEDLVTEMRHLVSVLGGTG